MCGSVSGPNDSVWSASGEFDPERAADHEADVAAGLAALLEPARERLGRVRAAAAVEQAHVRALGDPALQRVVVGDLDHVHARVAREQLRVVLEVVGVRRAAPSRPRPRSSARCGMLGAMGSDERERHFNLHTTPEVMAGRVRELRDRLALGLRVHADVLARGPRGRGRRGAGRRRLAHLAVAAGDARADRRHGGQLVQVAHPRRHQAPAGDPRPPDFNE